VSDENKKEDSLAEAKQEAAENQAAPPSAQTTSEPSDAPAAELKGPTDEEKEAKAKAAAEARAARATARAKQADNAEGSSEEAPKEPSPNQPKLERVVQLLKEQVAEEAIETAFINEKDGHTPYIMIRPEYWVASAGVLLAHEELDLTYLRGITGIDQETHLECAYNLISLRDKQDYCVKVKTDREQASIPSITSIWVSANWNEREIYDLLGIEFSGHPDLRRIMLTDDWVGHPLRKDYQPLDPEV
jgi:NADH-quinone oxidoreductase subunit C